MCVTCAHITCAYVLPVRVCVSPLETGWLLLAAPLPGLKEEFALEEVEEVEEEESVLRLNVLLI